MIIFLKQISGKIITLDVPPDAEIVDVAIMAHEKRGESQKDATVENYARSIKLTYSSTKLEYNKKLSDYGIIAEKTLIEQGKSFTMSPDFDWAILSIIDPISREVASDPFILKPGCAHTFEKANIKKWIETQLDSYQTPNCPCCRKPIDESHFAELHLSRQSSHISSASSATNVYWPPAPHPAPWVAEIQSSYAFNHSYNTYMSGSEVSNTDMQIILQLSEQLLRQLGMNYFLNGGTDSPLVERSAVVEDSVPISSDGEYIVLPHLTPSPLPSTPSNSGLFSRTAEPNQAMRDAVNRSAGRLTMDQLQEQWPSTRGIEFTQAHADAFI